MTVQIEFTPLETAWLNSQAKQRGLSPDEIIKRLVDAQVAVAPEHASSQPFHTLTDEQEAAIALLTSYLDTEATDDPQEIRKAEEDLEEFKRNMNANRAATGERLLFP